VSAVLILGVIAVLSTIVISLLSRSVVDVRISKQQEEQARIFSVAESALEKAFIGESLPTPASGEYDYQVTSLTKGGSGVESYVYPEYIKKDSPATIWLCEHEGADFSADAQLDLMSGDKYSKNRLTLYWGKVGASGEENEPALVAVLFYQDGGDYKTETFAYDPDELRRQNQTNFDSADAGGPVGEEEFEWSADLNVGCNSRECYFLIVRMLFSDETHPLGVEVNPGDNLPRQGECKVARATLQESGISSRVERCILYKDYNPIFNFVLYSGQDLVKSGG
jgi:hypothetical protein